jgi:phosphoserine phosphatase RsbU/P
VLADVAGKGIAAALVTAAVQSAIRIIASDQTVRPTEMVRKLNAFLYRNTGPSTYATLFFGSILGKQLRYVNAGHNPPWLFRPTGSDGHTAILRAHRRTERGRHFRRDVPGARV